MSLDAPPAASRRMWRDGRWLELLALAMLLLLVAVTGDLVWRARTTAVASATQQVARLDMVFAEQTGRAVETVDLIMRGAVDALQSAPAGIPPDPQSFDDLLRRRIAGVRQAGDVAITDGKGAVLYAAQPGTTALPAAGQALLVWHAANPGDALQISEPMHADDGSWSVLLSRRLDNPSGNFEGIVVAPTTAVPISTGFAVALNVFPAPSFSSR